MSTPVDDLKAELEQWFRELALAAERWVQARTAGQPTEAYDRRMREAERHTRRLERAIKRRTR